MKQKLFSLLLCHKIHLFHNGKMFYSTTINCEFTFYDYCHLLGDFQTRWSVGIYADTKEAGKKT